MNVIPNIIIGDPNANINADTLRTAYTKYNSHIHTYATSFNPLYYGLNLTEPITITYLGLLVSSNDTKILSISSNSIIINKPTLNNNLIEDAVLTQGNIEIYNIKVNQNSNEIYITEKAGFLSSQDVKKLKEEILILNISNPNANEVNVLLPPNFISKYYIQKISVKNNGNTLINNIELVTINSDYNIVNSIPISISAGIGFKEFDSVDISENLLITNLGLGIKLTIVNPSVINIAISFLSL